ncbi:Uncharacterised protein [Klebsiella pneumoniae]|nr:Uncharacterised protein [Klebsiella pneumoniae]
MWGDDFNLLMAAQLAFFNQYLAFGDAELFGEKFHQVGIGLAINGRGGNGDFKLVAMYATMLSRLALG